MTARCFAGAAAAVILGLAIASDAQAIGDCQPSPDGGAFTVFLSKPSYSSVAFPNDADIETFLGLLQFELDRGLVESSDTPVRFVACTRRAPGLDDQAFVPTVVEDLYNGRVLVEIWGLLDAPRSAAGAQTLSARVNYLLVPMKFASNRNEAAPAALQRLVYPEMKAAPTSSNFVQLIARPRDVDAFVAAAYGFKLKRELSNELAHLQLCRASALLGTIEKRQLTPRSRAEIAALRKFVVESARAAIEQGRAASESSGMWLQDPAKPCGGGP